MTAGGIASVEWRRPESLITMCVLVSIGVLLLSLICRSSGCILASRVSPVRFTILSHKYRPYVRSIGIPSAGIRWIHDV